MVALVTRDCLAGKWTKQAVYFALIITLLLQSGLNIGYYLIGRQAVIRVDGAIVRVICAGIIPPGWIPVARIPKIRGTEDEHDSVVMAVPPVLIVPLGFIVAESGIFLPLPVLASFNSAVLLKFHGWGLGGIWLFWNIEVLRLDGLRFCLSNIGLTLFCLAGGRSAASRRSRLRSFLFLCLLRS